MIFSKNLVFLLYYKKTVNNVNKARIDVNIIHGDINNMSSVVHNSAQQKMIT